MENIYTAKQDASKIKKAIARSQRCQRNWDLGKQIPEEELDLILTAATECPTKQNIPFYSIKVVQDRETIEEIYEQTFGPNPSNEQQGKKNPQVLANTLLVFTRNDFQKEIGKNRNPESAREIQTEEDLRILRDLRTYLHQILQMTMRVLHQKIALLSKLISQIAQSVT